MPWAGREADSDPGADRVAGPGRDANLGDVEAESDAEAGRDARSRAAVMPVTTR